MKNDKYMEKAIELNKAYNNIIKTDEGLFSLRTDIREINNHGILLGEDYIYFALENNLYDKDPYAKHRLHLNELEILEHALENNNLALKAYKPTKLFTYCNLKKRIDFNNADEIINELIEKDIIKVKKIKE